MIYRSTRGQAPAVSASEAVLRGLAPDGGLYVPGVIPVFAPGELIELAGLPYVGRAKAVLARFFDDFTSEELDSCIQGAWGEGSRFDGPNPAPVRPVGPVHMLELWHGPTCAFKDMALQFLPRAMVTARRKLGVGGRTLILAATSGDTGKAALEGFADVPDTHCAVFYPDGGVSGVQRLQMATQRGSNVSVIAVRGNFDDAQTGVKAIFGDEDYNRILAEEGWALSSANSINWGRLAPQIVYYVSAWCDLYNAGQVGANAAVDFVVPTGNFGNILAGWYARQMGVPIGRLVCASNRNRVLTDFFESGVYDMRRPFYKTISPSMDILVSSNLERLLYELSDREGAVVAKLMAALRRDGVYTVDEGLRAAMAGLFRADCADDGETAQTIAKVWQQYRVLLDPHTAVAWGVMERLGTERPTVVVSTANPYKFAGDVLNALEGQNLERTGGREDCEQLEALTGIAAPLPIAELWTLPERHDHVCDRQEMGEALQRALRAGDGR